MTKDKIKKFLNNQSTDAELKEIIEWANTEALSEESVRWGFADWNEQARKANVADDKQLDDIFDRIQERILAETTPSEFRQPRRTLSPHLIKAAAILFVPVFALLFYALFENAALRREAHHMASLPTDTLEVIAPVGSRTVVQLSDGSTAFLNHGSRLQYPQTFTGDSRAVTLSGEGYFEVAHHPDRPFIVKTGSMQVKALGTAFNVLAYDGDDEVETTLVEGKVVLEHVSPAGTIKPLRELMPGHHVTYNVKTGAVELGDGNVDQYVAWKDGKLVFDETTIVDAASKLERMFNVEITVKDDIKAFTYTVTFEDETLFQILDLMAIATPLQYKALPRKMQADGSFSKQKILLTHK